MKNIFLIMATKGGAGKTSIATNFLPMVFAKREEKQRGKVEGLKVQLYLIDSKNNNDFIVEASSAIEMKMTAKADNKTEIDNFTEKIEEKIIDAMQGGIENKIIIDIGGGVDTTNVLKSLGNTTILDDLSVILIPFFISSEYLNGVVTTVKEIRQYSKEVKIIFVANKIDKEIQDSIEFYKREPKAFIYDKIKEIASEEAQKIILNEGKLTFINDYREALNNAHKSLMLDNISSYINKEEKPTYRDELELINKEFKINPNAINALKDLKENRKKLITKHSIIEVYNTIEDFSETCSSEI